MNRRKALKWGLLAGGVLPAAAAAQDDPQVRRARAEAPDELEPAAGTRRAAATPDDLDPADEPLGDDPAAAAPDDFREESGHQWRSFDISRYTSQAYSPENPRPQNAIVEWIFRRTGSSLWHGEKTAVLSAGKAQLRAYHNPRVLDVVEQYVDRFTNATADVLSVRVRFVAAQDTRWRYAVVNRLKRIGSGGQGQQIWTVSPDEANLVRTQMMLYQGFKLLADKTVKMLNGQTMTMETSDSVDYVIGVQSDASGAQPRTERLKEGVSLRFSPLLNYDGDALDAAVEFRATTVKRLIRTKVLAQREVGPADVTIDVPEVVETRLNRTIDGWPLGQTVMITAGIMPAILQSKSGFLNLRVPGTVPSDTELLVFIDVEPTRKTSRSSAPGRDAADDLDAPADGDELDREFEADREETPRVPRQGRARDDF
jgi:hypothetical protein